MPATSSLHIMVRAHWINSWFVVPLARPYVRIDGQEHACHWNKELRVEVPAGRHLVETFMRYRGVPIALGTGRVDVDIDSNEQIRLTARNGWMNHMPFRPQVQASEG